MPSRWLIWEDNACNQEQKHFAKLFLEEKKNVNIAIAIAKGPTKTLFCDKHSWTRKLNCDLGMGRIATVATENASALDYKRTLYEGKREIVT